MAEEEKKRFLDGNEMELGEKQGRTFNHTPQPSVPRYNPPSSNWQNNPILPVVSYCASSILMTVANKYILSFPDYNLNFLLLAVQVRAVLSPQHACALLLTFFLYSLLSALSPFNPARPPVLLHFEISKPRKQRNVRLDESNRMATVS